MKRVIFDCVITEDKLEQFEGLKRNGFILSEHLINLFEFNCIERVSDTLYIENHKYSNEVYRSVHFEQFKFSISDYMFNRIVGVSKLATNTLFTDWISFELAGQLFINKSVKDANGMINFCDFDSAERTKIKSLCAFDSFHELFLLYGTEDFYGGKLISTLYSDCNSKKEVSKYFDIKKFPLEVRRSVTNILIRNSRFFIKHKEITFGAVELLAEVFGKHKGGILTYENFLYIVLTKYNRIILNK